MLFLVESAWPAVALLTFALAGIAWVTWFASLSD